jgi:hypothetical protein
MRDLSINSTSTWVMFIDNVSRLMGCHPSLLELGYVLPWRTKAGAKTTPKLLNDNESFEKMVDDVRAWRQEQASKSKGKGVVKSFSIRLVNLQADAAKPLKKVR